MAFPNGSNDAYSQMVEVEPTIWAIPGVAYHYLRADQRYFEKTGRRFRSTEGFRPIGEPGDWDGRPNTQWYYWERKIAHPSAPAGAYPGGSIHGWGRAFDIDLGQQGLDYDTMRALLEDEGFKFDIDGEPWHCNYYEADMWNAYSMAGLAITTYKSPAELEEEELMTAREDILNAIAAGSSRGAAVVYWNSETGRTYSVSPRCIKHHLDTVEYNIAIRESGQATNDREGAPGELAIGVSTFELVRVFRNNGLGEFGDENLLKNHAPGALFVPGAKI